MNFNEWISVLQSQIIYNKTDTFKTGIPALLFTIQTNLVYLAITNLDAAVYQVISLNSNSFQILFIKIQKFQTKR
jgi:hypothetical protein